MPLLHCCCYIVCVCVCSLSDQAVEHSSLRLCLLHTTYILPTFYYLKKEGAGRAPPHWRAFLPSGSGAAPRTCAAAYYAPPDSPPCCCSTTVATGSLPLLLNHTSSYLRLIPGDSILCLAVTLRGWVLRLVP